MSKFRVKSGLFLGIMLLYIEGCAPKSPSPNINSRNENAEVARVQGEQVGVDLGAISSNSKILNESQSMNLTQIIKDVGVKNTKIEDARAVSNPADTHKLAALTVANNVSLTQKQDSELSSGYNGIKGGDISDDITAGLTKDASAPTVVENVGDGSDVYVDKDVPISNSAATIRKHQRTGE